MKDAWIDMATFNPIEVQEALKGESYPASKQDLIETARTNGAGEDVLSLLKELSDVRFNTPAEVTEAVSFASKGAS